MNRVTKFFLGLLFFLFFFTIFSFICFIILLPINVGLGYLTAIFYFLEIGLQTIIGFINTLLAGIVDTYNAFVPIWNAFSNSSAPFFTIWNAICEALVTLINELVNEFCPDGLAACLSEFLTEFVINFFEFITSLLNLVAQLLSDIRTVLESVICSVEISNFIEYVIPAECTFPPLSTLEIFNWIAAIIRRIFQASTDFAVLICDFLADWTGERGLRAQIAASPTTYGNPHEFPVDLPKVSNIFQIFERVLFRNMIIWNGLAGAFWNLFMIVPDATACVIRIPSHFIPCVWVLVCQLIFFAFNLAIFGGLVLPGPIPDIPPISVVIDLATLFCVSAPPCPCLKCTNILGLQGPCVINSLTCGSCVSSDTLIPLFGAAIGALNPSFATSPSGGTDFNYNIQNVLVSP